MNRLQGIPGILVVLVIAGCGGYSEAEWQKMLDEQQEMKDHYEQIIADGEARIQELEGEVAELEESRLQAQKRLAMFKDLLDQFASLIESGKLSVKVKDGKMVLEMPGDVLFPSGKASLTTDGRDVLEEVAAVLAQIDGREFQVVGHTDSDPITGGPYDDNWDLSVERALGVVRYLQEQGVNPEVLSAAGYSYHHPEADNGSSEGKAQNRRVEIVIMPNLEELPDLSELEQLE